MKKLEYLLKALASRRRLEIIKFLLKGEYDVSQIAEHLNLSFRATSQHLRVLDRSDVIEARQEGTHVFYRLSKPYNQLVRTVIDLV